MINGVNIADAGAAESSSRIEGGKQHIAARFDVFAVLIAKLKIIKNELDRLFRQTVGVFGREAVGVCLHRVG